MKKYIKKINAEPIQEEFEIKEGMDSVPALEKAMEGFDFADIIGSVISYAKDSGIAARLGKKPWNRLVDIWYYADKLREDD